MSKRHTATIGLISNRNSGHNRDQFPRIAQLIETCPAINHITTESVADIPAALSALAQAGVDILAINGGDGTASAILGEMLENPVFPALPRVVLLPGGTANMTSGNIGARGKLLAATKRLVKWVNSGAVTRSNQVLQQALLRIIVEPQRPPVYGMFLGAGAVMQGTEYAHQEIHARGMRDEFSLALSTLRTVWGVFRKDPAFNHHVRVDFALNDLSHYQQHDTLILAISSLQRLFMGMRPFWGSEGGPIHFTLIEQDANAFLRTFLSIARGKPNRNAVPESGYISHNAQSIRLSLAGSVNIDGEITTTGGELTISSSSPLTFIRL